jgi:hypothetical protein
LALSDDGTTAFIGALGVKHERGAIDVFNVAAESAWTSTAFPTAILTDAAGVAHDDLGGIVRVSADGLTAVATAVGAAKGAGTADVFHVSSEGAWTTTSAPTARLTEHSRHANDELGWAAAVSADGTTAVAGAPGVNWNTGKAEVFHVADAGSWLTSSNPTATLTNSKLPKPVCVVPRLVGEPILFAKLDITYSDCRLGKVKRVHAKSKKWRKRVVSQSPPPGRRLRPGAKVNVKIGK